MEFPLVYRGRLRSANSSPREHKHELRRFFAAQLARLWLQPPLKGRDTWTTSGEGLPEGDFLRLDGDAAFKPLVVGRMGLVAELDITLLRPRLPGRVVSSGDLDNQVKTLSDALTLPSRQQWPEELARPSVENPLPVLLEDDRLVSALTVRTGQLLTADVGSDQVEALVWVRTETPSPTWGSVALG